MGTIIKSLAGALQRALRAYAAGGSAGVGDELIAARARLLEFSYHHSLDELLEETLNEAERLTASRIGFYHFVDDDQQHLTLQNWSTSTKGKFCNAEGKGKHYPIAKAGVWVDCVYQRKAVIHNDYAALPHKKGLPPGHAAVTRELVVPVMRGGEVKAILGVGNKPSDYDSSDLDAVTKLADLAWDIACSKIAEDSVRRAGARWSETFNAIDDAIWILDKEQRIVQANAATFRLLGRSRQEVLGRHCWEVVHGTSKPIPECPIIEATRTLSRKGIEYRLGNRILEVLVDPIKDHDGKYAGAVHIIRDITARIRAESRLSESEALSQDILRTSPWGMHFYRLMDGKLIFTGANPAADRILGVDNATFRGKSITEAFPPLVETEVPARYKAVIETGKPWETQQVSYSEGKISGSFMVSAFKTGPDSMAAAFVDNTEKAKYEEKLRKTAEELKKNLRLYRMLSRINQAAAEADTRETLYARICKTAVEEGGFSMAWAGVPDKYTGQLAPVSSAGRTGAYLQSLSIPLEEDPGRKTSHPAGRAISGGRIEVCMDIAACPGAENWKSQALAMGCASCAAVPLSVGGKFFGALSLYSPEKEWFARDELTLLERVKTNCELAIGVISSEEKRLSAESALRRTVDHLTQVMQTLPAVIFRMRRMGDILALTWVSGDLQGITGYDAEDMLRPEWFQRATFTEEREELLKYAGLALTGDAVTHDFRLKKKDGRVGRLRAQLRHLSGEEGEIIGSWTDIAHLNRADPGSPRP